MQFGQFSSEVCLVPLGVVVVVSIGVVVSLNNARSWGLRRCRGGSDCDCVGLPRMGMASRFLVPHGRGG